MAIIGGMAQGRKTSVAEKRRILQLHRAGESQAEICRKLHLSDDTVRKVVYEVRVDNGDGFLERDDEAAAALPAPRRLDEVSAEAREALEDRSGFLFCRRYMGLELSRFQQLVWEALEDLYGTSYREFAYLNAPPGLGKSTVFVAFGAKQIVRNRAVRVLFISRAHSLAERNVRRLRRLLERTAPAVGAAATLAGDFGRFKPADSGEVWRAYEFVVEQLDGTPVEEKEPTVASFGFDADWLGNRLDLVFGDDLDSSRSMSNVETVARNRGIFDDELEPRLDPPKFPELGGGLLCLGQQRLGVWDFSNHVASKRIPVEDDDGLAEDVATVPQYTHLVFQAHDESRCRGNETHRLGAPAWPEGCLLDPRRLGWRDLRKAMNNRRRFAVVYQQADADDSAALVQQLWVDGGRGADGVDYPGCWDLGRGLAEVPRGLAAPNVSAVSCDPSPTKFWSVQWWLVNVPTEQRFLLDLIRQAMDAPDFLDWNMNQGCYTGLLEEWWQRSNDMGVPFTYLIVEANAAQRFMLQYDLFRKWASSRKVLVIPHQTHRNKSDPEFGVQSIASRWRYGQVRLPGKFNDMGRIAALNLVNEVTRWPAGATDDCVMAQWFLEWNLARIGPPETEDPTLEVPGFVAARSGAA